MGGHLLLQTNKLQTEISINLTEEQLQEEPFRGMLQPTMEGPMSRVFPKIFKSISQQAVYTTSNYKNQHGFSFCRCALKANSGQLYPVLKGIIFVHSPTVFYSYDEIKSIEYERYDDKGLTTMDLAITLLPGRVDGVKQVTFQSIDRKEAPNLTEFFSTKAKSKFIPPIEESVGGINDTLLEDDEDDDESYNAEDSENDDGSDDSDDSDDDSEGSEEVRKNQQRKERLQLKQLLQQQKK